MSEAFAPNTDSLVRALLAGGPEVFQSEQQRRAELARDFVAAAHRRGSFVLPCGEVVTDYLDTQLAITKPTVLRRMANVLAAQIPPEIDRIAGREHSAVLVTALALETGAPFAIEHQGRIAGELHPDERVLLVEPVVATGSTVLTTANALAERGIEVSTVLAVVDRERGGAAAVTGAGYQFDAFLRLSELPMTSTPTMSGHEEKEQA